MRGRGIAQAIDTPFDDSIAAYGSTDVQGALAAAKVLLDGKVSTMAYGRWRNTGATQSLTTATTTQLNLGTEDVNSGDFTINTSNELQLDTALDFLYVTGFMTGLTSSATRGSIRALFYTKPSGGAYGAQLIDGRAYIRNATGSTQQVLHYAYLFGSPGAGDAYKTLGGITTGTGTTVSVGLSCGIHAIGFKI